MKTWMCFPGSLSISKHVTSRSRQRHQYIAHKTKDHLSLLSPNTPAPSRAAACQDPVPCLAAQPRVGLAVFFPKGTVTLSASGSKAPLVNVRSRCTTLLLQAQALAREHFESVKEPGSCGAVPAPEVGGAVGSPSCGDLQPASFSREGALTLGERSRRGSVPIH